MIEGQQVGESGYWVVVAVTLRSEGPNVAFGSKAVVPSNISLMSASGGKAAIRIFEGVRELCESVLMGCDESWVLQRASAGSI